MTDKAMGSNTTVAPNEQMTGGQIIAPREQVTFGQILATFLGTVIFVFSMLTLEALSRCSSMNKRIRTLAQLLTISNAMFCVSIILTVFINTSSLRHVSFVCNVNFGFSRISVLVNIFVITLVVTDRYFCIHYPRRYLEVITKRLLVSLYMAAWLLATLMTSFSIPDTTENCAAPYKSDQGFAIIMSYITCVVIICVVYGSIIHKIRMHMIKIRNRNQPIHFSGRSMYKSTINITIVVSIFMFCYLPVICYRVLLLFHPDSYQYTAGVRNFLNFSFFIGIAMNPATYIWIFPQYRLQLMKLFCSFNKKKILTIDRQIAIICAPYLENTPTNSQESFLNP